MKGSKVTQSRKSRSWWWDSHISPENSKWLSENLQEMETQVAEMLGLVEEEGESPAEKAEVYYQERPVLVAHIKNFCRMYRALAERYDNVTGELRKNIPSSLQSHGSGGISESDSETRSPSPSAEPDVEDKKGSDGSSSSSESESELDDAKEENGNSMFYALSQRIIELEDELHEARGKLDALEEKNMHSQNFGASSEGSEHDEKLQVSNVEIENCLEKDLEENNSEKEALEAVLLLKNETDGLKEAMASAAKQFEIELAHRDLEVDKCKEELRELSAKYLHDKSALEAETGRLQAVITNYEGELARLSQEKLQLGCRIEELEQAACSLDYSASEMVKLQEVIKNTKAELEEVSLEKAETIMNLEAELEIALQEKSVLQDRIKELEKVVCESLDKHSLEKSALSAEVLTLSEANTSLESKLASMEEELRQAYADKAQESMNSEKQICGLNQDLANLTSKIEVMLSEKATVDNKLATLLTDITSRDDKMKQMTADAAVVHKSLSELRARVSELEELVEKQKLAISESAEGKREAIRQLCFSLDHYRSGYQQLRQMLQQGHRRPLALMAA
ncbi:protein NETWORKED 4B-like [Lolium rigidum]|uniref:protein NETWORKED 4B-like n=1 Tax=Lolium rigidum TaxID=89674 RepID=UPI001F5E281D|nr:protein NETWORKED 4B-like [Lolium rigidum]XP_047044822.1 protein NETWORKED 4B-like [Lolium rigidum]